MDRRGRYGQQSRGDPRDGLAAAHRSRDVRARGSGLGARTGRFAHGLEREREIARRLESIVRIFFDRMTNDAGETGRRGRGGRAEIRRILAQDRGHRFGRRRAQEGALAAGELVEHDAQREQVRPRVGAFAPHLLGRHVAHGAENRAGVGRSHRLLVVRSGSWCRLLGQAEVENLHAAVAEQHDVLGLEIAVNDAAVVCGRQAARHLDRHVGTLPRRERTLPEFVAQCLAVEELSDQERRPDRALIRIDDLGAADVVHRHDIRVIDRGDRARLALESREPIGISCKNRGQHLDGDVAAEPRVPRPIDDAHTSGADERQDFVRTQPRAWGQRHWRGECIRGHNSPGFPC